MEDFEERWGFAPDLDYDIIRTTEKPETPEQAEKRLGEIMADFKNNLGLNNDNAG